MKKRMLICLLICLLSGLSVTYADNPTLEQTDEELIGVGIVTYGMSHLYAGLHEWGFIPVPGLSGSSAGEGSFTFSFTGVDLDGDGLFILQGTDMATVSENMVYEILNMTIFDGNTVRYTIAITASGAPDDELDITSLAVNGKSFTREHMELLYGEDE